MDIDQIKNKLKNTEVKPIDGDLKFSVLVPLIKINDELNIIYEVRSKSIRQPGEVSFPGGQIEQNESSQNAAIRETFEEIGIVPENIELISQLDFTSSKYGSFVFSFLGYIKNTNFSEIKYNKDEVSDLFAVPLSFFMNNEPEKYFIYYHPEAGENFPHHMINNGEEYKWASIKYPVYFYKFNNYIIWGLTAKITYNLIKKLK